MHALRSFARTPGFTIIALLSIAISIGATGVVFTAVIRPHRTAPLLERRRAGPASHRLHSLSLGVRMALGATPANVNAMVLRQVMTMAGIGVAIGLTSALILTRALRNLLQGLTSTDPLLIVITVAVVTATAAIACLIPAYRGTKVDPMIALRQE